MLVFEVVSLEWKTFCFLMMQTLPQTPSQLLFGNGLWNPTKTKQKSASFKMWSPESIYYLWLAGRHSFPYLLFHFLPRTKSFDLSPNQSPSITALCFGHIGNRNWYLIISKFKTTKETCQLPTMHASGHIRTSLRWSMKFEWGPVNRRLYNTNVNFLIWMGVLWLCQESSCFKEIHIDIFRGI